MPVPSYNVIADSEIDPESPITSSLMFRLRDNWMAILGIDNTDPAPAFSIPPASMLPDAAVNMSCGTSGNGTTATGAEAIVGVIDSSLETNEILYAQIINIIRVGANPDRNTNVEGLLIRPIWSSGTCTGVRIAVGLVSASLGDSFTTEGADTSGESVDITLANSWQTVYNFIRSGLRDNYIEAKARADSDYVYLQLRCRNVNNYDNQGMTINLVTARSEFKSKAAP